jgi:hypothetical protein
MLRARSAILVLTTLLLSTWTGVLASASEDLFTDSDEEGDASVPPNSQWSQIDASITSYPLRESSGLLYSPFGSFDPLDAPVPLGPENLYEPQALRRTGMLLVQSDSSDLTAMMNAFSIMEVDILDVIPDDAVVVRVDMLSNAGVVESINRLPSVRWTGALPVAWRVASELIPLSGRNGILVDLDVTPAPDLDFYELAELSLDLQLVSGAGVTSKSTSIPFLPDSGINSEATRHATGSAPVHLTLGSLLIDSTTPALLSMSTRTTTASSGITSRISTSMMEKAFIMAVKSELSD